MKWKPPEIAYGDFFAAAAAPDAMIARAASSDDTRREMGLRADGGWARSERDGVSVLRCVLELPGIVEEAELACAFKVMVATLVADGMLLDREPVPDGDSGGGV